MTERSSLIFVQAAMNAQRHFGKLFGKTQICRRSEYRVATKNQQQLDLASLYILDQLTQRLALRNRIGLHWRGVSHSVTDISQGVVHRVRQRMDDR